jgi:hypothetical protein
MKLSAKDEMRLLLEALWVEKLINKLQFIWCC